LKTRFHLALSAYWFGHSFLWGVFLVAVLANHVQRMAPMESARMLGILYFFGAAPALLVPLIAGPLSDRCRSRFGRRRPYMAWGVALSSVGLALMLLAYQARQPWAYVGAYLVLQIGSNIALAAYSGMIPDLVPTEHRGGASGWMAAQSQLGTLVGAVVGGQLTERNQDPALFGIVIAILAITLAWTSFGVREARFEGEMPPLRPASLAVDLWRPLQSTDFRWVWITRCLMMLGFYAVQPYILYYLADVLRVEKPAGQSANVMAVILLTATVSGLWGGKLSDRTGRKPIVLWSSILIAVCCLAFIGVRSMTPLLFLGAVFGIGFGAYLSVDWALGADVLPRQEDAGKDMAVWHVAMTLPQQVSPLIAGLILDAHRQGTRIIDDGKEVASYGLAGYSAVFCLAAALFFLGGFWIRHVRGAR
jgi:MFS family permease